MSIGRSFRTRLLLSFLLVIILAMLLPAWYARRVLDREIAAEAGSKVMRQLDLVQLMIEEESRRRSREELRSWLTSLAGRIGARISFVAPDGSVLADSGPTAADATAAPKSLADRPEIQEALRGDAGLDVRGDAIYAARRVDDAGGPAGALRLAAPYADFKTRIEAVAYNLLLIILLTLCLAVAASLFLARQISASIQAMIGVAEAIGRGNYGQRLRLYPGREFDALAQAVNAMAESIETNVRTITTQKEQLEAILNGMREGVLVLDQRGKIRSANRAMERIAPELGAFAGRTPLEALMSPELQAACDRLLGGSPVPCPAPDQAEQGAPAASAAPVCPADARTPYSLQVELGEDRIYDVSLVRLKEVGAELGAVAVFHDISELKRLERVRRDFVANVSHELRTPLTSIKGYAETLLGDAAADPKAARMFLEVILKNANHMAKMVNDLLSLARLEAGRMALRAAPVNPASALAAAYRECAPLAESRSIVLENRIPAEGLWVQADFDRLTQVFRNLLENAFRYGPPGSPVAVTAGEAGDMIAFGVRDAGPGVPRAERQRIFERFYRVEKHRAKHAGSSGLGLAISKHIVERLGGRIWVEGATDDGADGSGATFFFTLPRTTPEQLRQAAEERDDPA